MGISTQVNTLLRLLTSTMQSFLSDRGKWLNQMLLLKTYQSIFKIITASVIDYFHIDIYVHLENVYQNKMITKAKLLTHPNDINGKD